MEKITRYISLVLACALLQVSACKQRQPEGRAGKIRSVVILGNSIVEHGAAPQIGWNGSWGMAASARDSDFVHRLMTEVGRRDTTVQFRYANMVGFEWELDDFDYSRLDAFRNGDMIILRFSENVNDSLVHNGAFMRNYDKLLHYLDPGDKAVKVVVSGFWHRPNTNRLLEQYAGKNQYVFVRNDDLLTDSSNSAFGAYADKGVAAHPSDKGMRLIAARIWEKISVYFPE